jgi:hypothetical protein
VEKRFAVDITTEYAPNVRGPATLAATKFAAKPSARSTIVARARFDNPRMKNLCRDNSGFWGASISAVAAVAGS